MRCEVSAVRIRVDIETAVGVTAPVDAHGVVRGFERVAAGRCEAEGCLRFCAVAVWVGEDSDGLEVCVC